MTVKPYGREHALALLEPSGMTYEWKIDDRGVWPHERHEHLWRWGMPAEFEVTAWKPAVVFADDPDAPDLTKTPALPFPFDGRDLAAFMLAGYGCMVADFYGEWASGPDAHQLSRIDPGNNFAKRAVKEAFDAYRSAVGRVGGRDLELYRQACESCEAYTAARSEAIARYDTAEVAHPQPDKSDDRRREMDAEYTRRMALVNADLAEQEAEMNRLQAEDKAAEQKWRHAMAVELLKPATDAAEPEVPPAHKPVTAAQTEAAHVVELPRPSARPIETPEERRARWLDMFEKMGGADKRGALAELSRELNVDRSNLKKDLNKAEEHRKEKRREGAFGVAASQLVRNGKRRT